MDLQSLLNPEYITAHLQNGIVLDLIQTPGNTFQTHPSMNNDQQNMIEPRFMNDNDISQTDEIQMQQSNGVHNVDDHGVTQAFLQYVNKQEHVSAVQQIIKNETQVIVSNKV